MRLFSFAMLALLAGLLAYAAGDLPARGALDAPASIHVATTYIESSIEDANTPNMVTAVLADYRGFDTFGEAVVVFAAALSCLLILVRRRREDEAPEGEDGR